MRWTGGLAVGCVAPVYPSGIKALDASSSATRSLFCASERTSKSDLFLQEYFGRNPQFIHKLADHGQAEASLAAQNFRYF